MMFKKYVDKASFGQWLGKLKYVDLSFHQINKHMGAVIDIYIK